MLITSRCHWIPRTACAFLLTALAVVVAFGQTMPADANTPAPSRGSAAGAFDAQIQAGTQASLASEEIHRNLEERYVEDLARLGEIAASGLLLFPPVPPALGAPPKADDGPVYPEILANYAGEPFFMPYCSLRLRGLLSQRRLQRVEQYQADRARLLRELRDALARAGHESAAAQPVILSRLAATQEKRLHALEKEGENIRVDLTTPVKDQPYDAGAALANARDAIEPGEQPGMKKYCTAILAAQFQAGLSLDQRLMLQEIAADSLGMAPSATSSGVDDPAILATQFQAGVSLDQRLRLQGVAADSLGTAQTESGSGGAEFRFFLPGSAHLRWPEKTDAVLARKLELFQEKRTALKQDLTEAVTGVADERPDPKHAGKYASLSNAQAPRFAELEVLAEEIRVAPAGLRYPDEPTPSNLPADLVSHVGHMMDGKNALLREVQRAGKEFGRDLAPERVEVAYQSNSASLALLPAVDSTASLKKNRKEIIARLQTRNGEFKQRFAKLAVEMDAVRAEIQRYHDSLSGNAAPDVNDLSIQLARVYVRQETWNRFRDYRTAALTPGLSPAQRRLLFTAAVADLEKFRLSLAN